MAGSNTEKPMGKAEQKKQNIAVPKKGKIEIKNVPKAKPKENVEKEIKEKIKTEEKKVVEKTIETKLKPEEKEVVGAKVEDKKKVEEKKPVVKIVKKKIIKAVGRNLPISTKVGAAIAKFIKGNTIEKATEKLQMVAKLKIAVPMKGEIPHRKGKIMSGRFPKRAALEVIELLKTLKGNTIQHEMEEGIITSVVANKGPKVYGKMGRVQKKRTHLTITFSKVKKTKKEKKK